MQEVAICGKPSIRYHKYFMGHLYELLLSAHIYRTRTNITSLSIWNTKHVFKNKTVFERNFQMTSPELTS